ncbi:hypothetical protein [Aminobacter sp. MDW-2]|uniref:hypothetical protein n=1 Tax=Aminobacter sp. MDW-2 TaxID=2666139 RepID=UPI0012B07B8A|nr:hypothetical protein [Aminobacter sp. MDW-2]MRX36921.1 hypothetical protein [Aminobacter sp. MDW-2]QNH37973.1 hypothetical protein H5P29_31380 [Aminobacter sp. MDW-2]
MRFRPWPKPEPYYDTSRKRAVFKRKQRLEREALPLFADKDEQTYLRILDRLRRKIERQDAAIEALRRKYRVNAQRPVFTRL